jgi:hypothetical protein
MYVRIFYAAPYNIYVFEIKSPEVLKIKSSLGENEDDFIF